MALMACGDDGTDDETTSGIPEQNRVEVDNGEAFFGRPQYKLSYYSHSINAHAFRTFETRHEAVGAMAKLDREDRGKHFKIQYRETYC